MSRFQRGSVVKSTVSSAYVCALQKEVPYHGRLYLTEAHACFYSSVLLKDTKVNSSYFVLLLIDRWSLMEMTSRSTSDLLVFFTAAPAGRYSTLFHSHGEETQHGPAGPQRLVGPHRQRGQGGSGCGRNQRCRATTARPVSACRLFCCLGSFSFLNPIFLFSTCFCRCGTESPASSCCVPYVLR